MNPSLERGRLLLAQDRTELAAQEFARALSDNPDDPRTHALLALTLSRLGRHTDAVAEAQAAVGLAPDYDFAHYVLGIALRDADKLAAAETAAQEACRLDPENADACALLATILARRGRWTEARDAAERGVLLDPDNTDCANLRAMALVHLGQKQEAGETLRGALAKDPQNALTHANQGWALLHAGRPAEALPHFREALRLEPDHEWARQGILEALRARNPIYRVLLQYFLWTSRLGQQARWGVLIGVWVGGRALRGLRQQYPALAPFITPLLIVYFLFLYLTWTAKPLFNLLLRLNRDGRYALTRDQRVASDWFGATLLAAALCGVAEAVMRQGNFIIPALVFAALTIPVAHAFGRSPKVRKRYLAFLGVLAALGTWTIGASFLPGSAMLTPGGLFVLSFIAFMWVSSAVSVQN